jgi:SAM-dependent methyltransferase
VIRDPYDPFYYSWQRGVEGKHFWFRARRRLIAAAVRSATEDLPSGFLGLEIGCGTGSVLAGVQAACPNGRFFGLDVYLEGLRWARADVGPRVVQGDAAAPPFGRPFAVIGLFDVLEHVPDDEAALRNLRASLDDDGKLVMTVPARRALWSDFDEIAHHERRYDGTDLDAKVIRAGYAIEFRTEFMAPLLPLLWALRRLPRLGRSSFDPVVARQRVARELRVPRWADELLYGFLAFESDRVARRRRMPFGSSLLMIARKA